MTDRPRVVVVGGGFAGFHAARNADEAAGRRPPRSCWSTRTDYFLYLPLLPEVAAGVLDPRRIAVSLAGDACRACGSCSARSTTSTSTQQRVGYTDPEGGRGAHRLRPAACSPSAA